MNYSLIENEWRKSVFPKPKILLLVAGGKYYAVVEDDTPVIVVASKSEIIYAITQNRVKIEKIGNINVYMTDDLDNLKIISCTRETIEKRHKDQFFVINNIIKYI